MARVPPNSFSNYDETRAVTTPRSLTACALEGVDPAFLAVPTTAPRRKSVVGRVEVEKDVLRMEAQSHERQQVLQLVRARYKLVVANNLTASAETLRIAQQQFHAQRSRSSSTSSPTKAPKAPSSESGSRNSPLKRGAPSVAKGAEAAQYDAALREEAMKVVSDDVTVAKRFLRLKKAAEEKRLAQEKLEVREANGAQRFEAVQRLRAEEAAARTEKFESTLKRVLHSKDKQLEEWHARHEARAEERKQRQETAEKQVTQLKQARKGRAGANSGEAERLAAESHRLKLIAELETKIEAANQVTEERKQLKKQEDEIAAFKMDLKRQQVEEERKRAKRAQVFRQAQIREQEKAQAQQDQEEAAVRTREAKSRALIRDILAKQHEEVEAYMHQHQDDPSVPAPKWLEPRIALLLQSQEKQKGHPQSSTTPKKVPAPPPQQQFASSARPAAASTNRSKHQDDEWMSSSSNADRLPAVPRSQFTMSSPRLSERQVFGKWMFE